MSHCFAETVEDDQRDGVVLYVLVSEDETITGVRASMIFVVLDSSKNPVFSLMPAWFICINAFRFEDVEPKTISTTSNTLYISFIWTEGNPGTISFQLVDRAGVYSGNRTIDRNTTSPVALSGPEQCIGGCELAIYPGNCDPFRVRVGISDTNYELSDPDDLKQGY
ncbi:hypothetical protein MPER_12271 [Moniliophthora perniciosa FA553]|nr:hypothetical protein MPER_12271 [Moniliophthora perniciosa FA553]